MDLVHASTVNRFLLPQLIARYFLQAQAIVAPSRGVADDLARVTGLPRQRIHVIYNPVVSAALLMQSRLPVDHRWLRGDGVPVIVGMGRLTLQKDFGTLIRAFARVRKQLKSRLLILGEGEERGALQDLSHSLGVTDDVELVGFVANPYAYLSRAELFVLSSRWEGLPGALIEALACGAKVVSTDCPSGPREILNDGAYGQLVPMKDDGALAEAMLAALTGEYVAADSAGWIGLFDAEDNIDHYLNLLVGEESVPAAHKN